MTGAVLKRLFGRDLPAESIDVINAVQADYLFATFETIKRKYSPFGAYIPIKTISRLVLKGLRQVFLAY